MKKSLPICLIALLGYLALPAQDTTWFNADWKECDRSEAKYYHLETKKDGIVHYADYFISNNQVQNTGSHRNGKKVGEFIWYYENGQKSQQINYVKGRRHGPYAYWHSNGVVKEEGEYRNGVRQGPLIMYDKEGNRRTSLKGTEADADFGELSDNDLVMVEESDREIDPNDFMILDEEPMPINMYDLRMAIGYPAVARQDEIEGKVILRILVSEKGLYVKHIVIYNPSDILTDAVEQHIDKLRWTPGIMNGKPIKAWVTVPFAFQLLR